MDFGPSFDFDESRTAGDESEKEESEDGLKGLGHTLFGSWIGHFFETLDENFERNSVGHL